MSLQVAPMPEPLIEAYSSESEEGDSVVADNIPSGRGGGGGSAAPIREAPMRPRSVASTSKLSTFASYARFLEVRRQLWEGVGAVGGGGGCRRVVCSCAWQWSSVLLSL